jgi:AraC-like DNA-binding protein
MYSISPVYARFVLRELIHRGLCEQTFFAGTPLNRHQLETGGNIAMADFVTLLDNARKLSGDEQLGLLIGRHSNVATLGPIGAAAATAPSVREGLQVLENFTRLHASYIRVELVSDLRAMSVRIRFLEDLGELERFHAEAGVMLVQHYVEMVTGRILDDAQYRMGFDAPAYVGAYGDCMHSAVSFGFETTSMELSHHWLDLPSPYFNAEIWAQAQSVLEHRITALGDEADNTYTQHVSALLRSYEPPLPDLAAVAARLHLSQRTLNRRLQREGSSFREIRATVLATWARQYLAQTDSSVEAIAMALGYQDVANFRRAFRAWQHCSPAQYRRNDQA